MISIRVRIGMVDAAVAWDSVVQWLSATSVMIRSV